MLEYHVTNESRQFRYYTMVCPICGREFTVRDRAAWVYKKQIQHKHINQLVYVHTWSCFTEMERRIKAKNWEFLEGVKNESKRKT